MSWNKICLPIFAAAALGACSYDEAGLTSTSPGFGEAVATNHAVQVGYATEGALFDALSARFEQQVPTTVNFDFNRSTLGPEARAILDQQANWLRNHPEARLRVEGHTDLVGGENFNLSLGLRRAESAVAYLVSRGVDRSRLDAVSTFGETMPVVATEQRERLNRRTVTRVAGIAAELAGSGFDGKRAVNIYDAYVNKDAIVDIEFASGE
ncbi:OmpA family protein [Pontivivens ytuae]|uniref:OmpA family protein n=1 Tax=Pontivivens ytuae TaxID=2789856 RepID=A0A7S9QED7_9RHOB|nr:OmpA family protein [Pontivivens ytuae]QPH55297.1 OmpA family protein [Pontivivens ytuae]